MNRFFAFFYDAIAPFYDYFYGPHIRYLSPLREEAVGRLHLHRGDKVLETGIGTGANLEYLSAKVGRGRRIYGLDISKGMLGKCAETAKRLGIPVSLKLGKAESLPYGDGTFDAVFHLGGINYFDDKEKALDEMARVAKKGAKVVVIDEYFPTLKVTHPPRYVPASLRGRRLTVKTARLSIFTFHAWMLEFTKR